MAPASTARSQHSTAAAANSFGDISNCFAAPSIRNVVLRVNTAASTGAGIEDWLLESEPFFVCVRLDAVLRFFPIRLDFLIDVGCLIGSFASAVRQHRRSFLFV